MDLLNNYHCTVTPEIFLFKGLYLVTTPEIFPFKGLYLVTTPEIFPFARQVYSLSLKPSQVNN